MIFVVEWFPLISQIHNLIGIFLRSIVFEENKTPRVGICSEWNIPFTYRWTNEVFVPIPISPTVTIFTVNKSFSNSSISFFFFISKQFPKISFNCVSNSFWRFFSFFCFIFSSRCFINSLVSIYFDCNSIFFCLYNSRLRIPIDFFNEKIEESIVWLIFRCNSIRFSFFSLSVSLFSISSSK